MGLCLAIIILYYGILLASMEKTKGTELLSPSLKIVNNPVLLAPLGYYFRTILFLSHPDSLFQKALPRNDMRSGKLHVLPLEQ